MCGQLKEWQLIVDEWGGSSVQLKNFLKKYCDYNTDNAKLGDINVNYILPYRNNAFFVHKDLYRLKYAMKAVLIILGTKYGQEDIKSLYAYECLRLWLRFDSRKTYLTFENFVNMTNEVYGEVETDWKSSVEEIQDICYKYKPRRKQTMYHFREEDFNLINEEMTLGEAYDFWMYYEFPNILNRYKQGRLNEFKANELNKFGKVSKEKYEAFKKDLDLIKIKEPNIGAFTKLLKRLHIKYKKK